MSVVMDIYGLIRDLMTEAEKVKDLGLIITRRWMKNGCLRLKQSLIPDWKK